MDGDFNNLGRLFAIKYDPLYHVPREKDLCIPRERGNKKVFSAKKKTGNAFNIIGRGHLSLVMDTDTFGMIFDYTQFDGIEKMAKSMMCLIPQKVEPEVGLRPKLVPYLDKKGYVFILIENISF
jgi:hypothetical protein